MLGFLITTHVIYLILEILFNSGSLLRWCDQLKKLSRFSEWTMTLFSSTESTFSSCTERWARERPPTFLVSLLVLEDLPEDDLSAVSLKAFKMKTAWKFLALPLGCIGAHLRRFISTRWGKDRKACVIGEWWLPEYTRGTEPLHMYHIAAPYR